MRYTTLLMDADDTIFDFPQCEYHALKNTLEFYGLAFSEEIYHKFSSINAKLWKKFEVNEITRSKLRIQRFRELIEKCFDGFEEAEKLADKYVEKLSEQAILLDGAYQAVKELSKYYSIYIITNGLKPVQRGRFARTELTKFIRKLYISDEMNVQKPGKAFFDYVMNDIPEKDKNKILVVGDSLTSDMQGGKNAGLATCLYDPKNKTAMPHELCDYKITKLTDILKIDTEGSL